METPINNIHDLKLEIARLKNLELDQSVALKARFNSPAALFSSVVSIFPKSPTVDGVKSASFFDQDFLGLVSRVLLPLTLNKTIFKNSNFIVKTLVGLLSQKASHYISEDAVGGIWGKAKGFLEKFTKKRHEDGKEVLPAYKKYYKGDELVSRPPEAEGEAYAG